MLSNAVEVVENNPTWTVTVTDNGKCYAQDPDRGPCSLVGGGPAQPA